MFRILLLLVTTTHGEVVARTDAEVLLIQYDSESESDGALVRNMLFMQRMADDVSVPMEKRIEYANSLKALYKEDLELAVRNAVWSPFSSGF
jgi:hypothetical protein